MDNFDENLARYLNPDLRGQSNSIDIGGSRDERLADAVVAALSDLDNLDDEFARAFERFSFTHDEMEKAKKG